MSGLSAELLEACSDQRVEQPRQAGDRQLVAESKHRPQQDTVTRRRHAACHPRGVKTRLLYEQNGERTFAVIFDKDDEARNGLTSFAREHNANAAQFTAVGGFRRAVLGYFDRERKTYLQIPIEEQVELLSCVGDIAVKPDGSPEVHAHVVVGRSDGTTRGGHLLEAYVWPTMEVIVRDVPQHLRRVHDDETGLALIDPSAP
jgi:predicted DNA-binding protein with PD1-like motif